MMRWSRVEQLTEVEPSKLYIQVGWLIRAENPSEFRVLMYSFDTMFDLFKGEVNVCRFSYFFPFFSYAPPY